MPKIDDPPPQRPTGPDPAECCGEGCAKCVYDTYEEALARYGRELADWHARQDTGTGDHPGSVGGA